MKHAIEVLLFQKGRIRVQLDGAQKEVDQANESLVELTHKFNSITRAILELEGLEKTATD